MTITEMNRRWGIVVRTIEPQINHIIGGLANEAIKLNQYQLYQKGIGSDGEKLAPYRSIAYALDKNKINASPGVGSPDLYLTGKFYKGFYAQVKSKKLEMGSTDMKSSKLEAKYGNKIFGLTHDNIKVFRSDFVFPKIISYIKKVTGL